jgi:hypothetical protein
MSKKLRGDCSHCGMPIAYPAEAIGTLVPCPHCKKPTELLLSFPPDEPLIPRKVMIWTVISVFVLLLALIGTLQGLKHAQKLADERNPQTDLTNNSTR